MTDPIQSTCSRVLGRFKAALRWLHREQIRAAVLRLTFSGTWIFSIRYSNQFLYLLFTHRCRVSRHSQTHRREAIGSLSRPRFPRIRLLSERERRNERWRETKKGRRMHFLCGEICQELDKIWAAQWAAQSSVPTQSIWHLLCWVWIRVQFWALHKIHIRRYTASYRVVCYSLIVLRFV